MSKLFIHIFNWFERHKKVFYAVLILLVAVFAVMASRISFQENIANFFDTSGGNKNAVFQSVKAKDKIIVLFSGEDPSQIIESAEIFQDELESLIRDSLVNSVTAYADEEVIAKVTSFIYEYLPIFLDDSDYQRLGDQLSKDAIDSSIGRVYALLTSPSGMFVGDIVMRDPLNIATHLLQKLEQFNPDLQYEIYDGRLFTSDLSTMLIFVEPSKGMANTGENDKLVSRLEKAEQQAEINGVKIDYVGGPVVAVYNARQIKQDTTITLSLAMLIVVVVIFFSFRNRWSILLLVVPPIFGALFALAMVWLIQGEMSAIAMGAGAVVLGISLSYSIHFVSHLNYTSSPTRIIRELATPLTIGCLTTIGAFAALMFTSSALLQDMGLFSMLALIGTALFCLIFLPHFLKRFTVTKKSFLLDKIERIVGFDRYKTNLWVVLPIILATVVGLFFYKDVKFDDDMSNINFTPSHIVEAEARSAEIFGDSSKDIYLVTGSDNIEQLTREYSSLTKLLNEHLQRGDVSKVVTVNDFVVSVEEQKKRIDRWNSFWAERRTETLKQIDESAQRYGFRKVAFDKFGQLLSKEYAPCTYSRSEIGDVPVISEWVSSSGETTSMLCRITVEEENKAALYEQIDQLSHTAVIDRAYFSSKMVESTSEDFNYILFISSLIVFLALLISYGRLELTLLTFLPMAMSWVIILAFMAIADIKFNIVNIVLATFIFGLGDDFSVFIMDGLLQDYKDGKKVLGAHKTAIFFAAFTSIVGMGVLIFARHPALKSIALISVLGLSVVVLVSYTVQPMLFRLFVTSQTERGGFPHTILSLLNTLYCFLYFLMGCIILQIYILILMVLPVKRKTKKLAFHKAVYRFTGIFLNSVPTVRKIRENPHGETYEKPAVIIANHQSFIDILLLLSTTPKIVMVTKSWVWNSPFFGWIVKYADFHHSADGYEPLAEKLKERVTEGYSVVIFPEGTRSVDCSIQRFHKGAFYLAQLLKLDILPMMIYGAGQISAKKQGFYIKRGLVVIKTMKRVVYGDTSFGESYQQQAKNYRRWYIEQYRKLNDRYGRTCNAYFRDALIKNYIYKTPVLEWYMRIKCRIDGYYDLWDRLLPRDGKITDLGCGYGQLSFMLGLLSPERELLGIDYDRNKVDLAEHSFLTKLTKLRFLYADMRSVDLPKSDAVIFNDSLHYVDSGTQEEILKKTLDCLNPGGVIVVRDGDSSQKATHDKIEKTEVWSTKILGFNKTSQELSFVSSEWMQQFATSNGVDIKIRRCDNRTSETLYILSRKSDEEL
jgi:1-acyl-sn-glycerol-3-phosphate acyltransferase